MFGQGRYRRKTAFLLILVFLTGALTGCGEKSPEKDDTVVNEETVPVPVSMEESPVLSYEVPIMQPGIVLNQIGFDTDSLKTVVFRGRKLPGEFQIINSFTGETVYTGSIEEPLYYEASEEYISHCDFTAFTEQGTYYIKSDILGQSYLFVIKADMTEELMEEAVNRISQIRQQLTAEDIKDVCRGLSVLLLSYELYAPVYNGATGTAEINLMTEIRASIDWLLTMQDKESGVVMAGEEVLPEETAWVSAVLAKFSYTYQKVDSKYATACLQAADRAWNYLDKMQEAGGGEARFFAAAELFRATGQYKYHTAVKNLGKDIVPEAERSAYLFGTMTYAATKRRVDVKLCAALTKVLFDEAEDIAGRIQADTFFTESIGMEELLWNMVVISSIDYIITNHEYAVTIAHCNSFLAGENKAAICFIPHEGRDRAAQTDMGASCFYTAEYIMMLSEMMSH